MQIVKSSGKWFSHLSLVSLLPTVMDEQLLV